MTRKIFKIAFVVETKHSQDVQRRDVNKCVRGHTCTCVHTHTHHGHTHTHITKANSYSKIKLLLGKTWRLWIRNEERNLMLHSYCNEERNLILLDSCITYKMVLEETEEMV